MTLVNLAAEKFGDSIRLNLGCGEYHVPDFVNVDLYCEKADVKGDILELEFADVDEVLMSHILEHVSHQFSDLLLGRIRSWMNPGAHITIEVPDVSALLGRGEFDIWTEIGLYGVQTAPGEFHYSGWTLEKLVNRMIDAGFHITSAHRFVSTHPARTGFPCIEAIGIVPS